jgi:methyl coenzyme M reductase gamma subunit
VYAALFSPTVRFVTPNLRNDPYRKQQRETAMTNTILNDVRELINDELEFVSGGEISGESARDVHPPLFEIAAPPPGIYEKTLGLLMKAMGA